MSYETLGSLSNACVIRFPEGKGQAEKYSKIQWLKNFQVAKIVNGHIKELQKKITNIKNMKETIQKYITVKLLKRND